MMAAKENYEILQKLMSKKRKVDKERAQTTEMLQDYLLINAFKSVESLSNTQSARKFLGKRESIFDKNWFHGKNVTKKV